MQHDKPFFAVPLILFTLILGACSTNPATGNRQFAALMSPAQEIEVGASEHQKIIKQYGIVDDPRLTKYVEEAGRKVTTDTERPDVDYKFFILDSPIVNAFALPGGYIYISRGLLALANSEAEMASVLGHEAGHITGRHSAERYSRGVVTTLGASILSAAIGSQGASQAIGLGTNLYLSSYSRDQENEADTLGLRYMTRGGYDPQATPSFLYSLQRQSELEAQIAGQSNRPPSYFSTHPATAGRVSKTKGEVQAYPQTGKVGKATHLNVIDGMIYGDSAKQGFARGDDFYHPAMGFTFSVPNGFTIKNGTSQVIATNKGGSVILFDMTGNDGDQSATDFIARTWLKETNLQGLEAITVNGMPAATASFQGNVSGKTVTIRVVAIKWGKRFVRFQVAIPQNASNALITDLKSATYSFRNMSAKEKRTIKPHILRLYTARSGDTVAKIARRMPFDTLQEQRFRILNGLTTGQGLTAGQKYKIVSAD
jgi:predicted Zn-dependent protease